MPLAKRYFTDDDPEHGLTPAQLKRTNSKAKVEYMVAWFRDHFEDPSFRTPYESSEGGFIWVFGGPYNAYDELFGEFHNIATPRQIEEAIKIVQSDGIWDWAPGNKHPDWIDAHQDEPDFDDEDEVEEPPTIDDELKSLLERLEQSARPIYGSGTDFILRQRIVADGQMLIDALRRVQPKPVHGSIGHNRPPEEGTLAHALEQAIFTTEEIQDRLKQDAPNALEVVKSTSRLRQILNFGVKKGFEKIAEKGLEEGGKIVLNNPYVQGALGYVATHALTYLQQIIAWVSGLF